MTPHQARPADENGYGLGVGYDENRPGHSPDRLDLTDPRVRLALAVGRVQDADRALAVHSEPVGHRADDPSAPRDPYARADQRVRVAPRDPRLNARVPTQNYWAEWVAVSAAVVRLAAGVALASEHVALALALALEDVTLLDATLEDAKRRAPLAAY